MPPVTKNCPKCERALPLEAFSPQASGPHGRRSHCKECRRVVQRPAVDEGFEVVQTGTEVDADGTQGKQWVKARPERPVHAGVTEAVPHKHLIKGVSTLVDQSGQVVQQWIKTKQGESERTSAMLDALASISGAWTGENAARPAAPPSDTAAELLACYPMGDPHIGMFSWAAETGNNFDLKIAERNLYGAVDALVTVAPPAKQALIVSVGDYFHADGKANTTTGGTPVDVDGRFAKVMGVGVRLQRRLIDRALEKHEHVTWRGVPGNHDDHASLMLAICLAQYYEREPRVTVSTDPGMFQYHRFGRNLIATTHGHMAKLADLGEIMACDCPEDWAATLYRYWITGHIHHDTVKELRGCIVESFRTLAPGDAWHRGKGYRSGRDMKVLVFHSTRGQILRHTVGINDLQENL